MVLSGAHRHLLEQSNGREQRSTLVSPPVEPIDLGWDGRELGRSRRLCEAAAPELIRVRLLLSYPAAVYLARAE